MLRSILNSVRGRSSLANVRILESAPGAPLPGAATPYIYSDFSSIRPAAPRAPAQAPQSMEPAPVASSVTVRPERCCVYCGHGLYAPPRIARVRCPRCFAELPIRDIVLSGDAQEASQFLTAGKITVADDAQISAQLVACSIDVAGRVLGDILASQTCRVRSTGKVAGRILCRHLQLDPGAVVESSVELIRN